MCGDYLRVNKETTSDCYPMPTPEELCDVVEHAQIFSTLDLRFGHHQLRLWLQDRVKIVFWGIDCYGNDQLYH